LESADRARRERNITIAIGVVLVLLIAAFVVRNRFRPAPAEPVATEGIVVSEIGEEEALEDFLRTGNHETTAPDRETPRPRREAAETAEAPPAEIAPPGKPVEAEISVSVGGQLPSGKPAPGRERPKPGQAAEAPQRPKPAAPEETPSEVVEPVKPKPRRRVIYTVQRGDTLSKIAEKFYERGSDWVLIRRANNLASANMLHVGQKLVIPSKDAESAPPRRAPASTPARAAPPATGTYKVKKDDTLWRIASRVYGDGSKWTLIFQANRNILRTQNDLKVGQVLKIPELQGR
jgi:nucleoid-associated protein YgaU